MPKIFSLDQANNEVVKLRPILEEIMAIRADIMDKRPEVWSVLAKAASNGGNQALAQIDQNFLRIQSLIKTILLSGVEIKDLDSGLLDFRSIREGREVYLCWKYGEGPIEYWHELDEGFAGRQKL